MRNFLLFVVGTATVLLALWLGAFYFGYYIDLHPDQPVEAVFRTGETGFERREADGRYTALRLRAVDVSASMPGQPSSAFAADEADYLRWLKAIGEMGANTVQVDTLMDEDFYNALYDYNTTHEAPLYLMQCLSVTDDANYGAEDAYADDFYARLIADGKAAVDIIHGRRNVSVATTGAVGYYRRDVSPWVLGYIVGYSWDDDTVAYTDHRTIHPQSFAGTWFTTAEGASRFEAMLAAVMDSILDYEAGKYKQLRLISFANDPSNDPFEYDETYAEQLPKFSRIDGEHILPNGHQALFFSYRLYDFVTDPISLFSAAQLSALRGRLGDIDRSAIYDGYLDLLAVWHTRPVYIMGYGFSTARAPIDEDQPPLTEEEQGEALVRVWRETVDAGLAGACISGWQDSWERRTWNVSFASTLTRSPFWHDLQSDGQNYGLMAFAPGEEAVCVLDGDGAEWADVEPVLSTEEYSLRLRYDAEALYLLITGKDAAKQPLYLPIDTTPESGSAAYPSLRLNFDRPADFLLCVNGGGESRLLVQQRYDAMWENFAFETQGRNPFFNPPDVDTAFFQVSRVAVSHEALLTEDEQREVEQSTRVKDHELSTWDTGQLVAGNGDPEAADYNSLADICFGEDCVEIRLPWLLLNFCDPSEMSIHKDYYTEFGVSGMPARQLWIGLGAGDETITLSDFPLRGWGDSLKWRERLKRSYPIVQAAWKEAAG